MIIDGHSSQEMADFLRRSRNSIDIAVNRIIHLTGTRNRPHLTAWFLRGTKEAIETQQSFRSDPNPAQAIDVPSTNVRV